MSQNIGISTLNGVRYINPFSTYFILVECPQLTVGVKTSQITIID